MVAAVSPGAITAAEEAIGDEAVVVAVVVEGEDADNDFFYDEVMVCGNGARGKPGWLVTSWLDKKIS